jgi:hypothetical protein
MRKWMSSEKQVFSLKAEGLPPNARIVHNAILQPSAFSPN